jgi:hypothetical protein
MARCKRVLCDVPDKQCHAHLTCIWCVVFRAANILCGVRCTLCGWTLMCNISCTLRGLICFVNITCILRYTQKGTSSRYHWWARYRMASNTPSFCLNPLCSYLNPLCPDLNPICPDLNPLRSCLKSLFFRLNSPSSRSYSLFCCCEFAAVFRGKHEDAVCLWLRRAVGAGWLPSC